MYIAYTKLHKVLMLYLAAVTRFMRAIETIKMMAL